MHHVIDGVQDLTLELFEDVTRHGGTIQLSSALKQRIDERRAEFLAFVEYNREVRLYGITTMHHVGAKNVMEDVALSEYSTRMPASGSTFGPGLPDRLARGIIVARLADFLNGTGCLRSETVERITDMLAEPEQPFVPERGCGEPGDIIPLGYLFRRRFNGTLKLGEGMAMINGSPVAAAALADAALGADGRADVAEKVFALAAFAAAAPLAHFDEFFETAWGDDFQGRSLRRIRELLVDNQDLQQLAYQAPVSFRSAPRLLGSLRRYEAEASRLALIGLRSSSNNPAFLGPKERPPFGAVLSNGGYHNAFASAALDGLTRSWADTTQLLAALTSQVTEMPGGLLYLEPESEVSTLYHVATGWAEEARAAATPTLLSLGNGGQTDTGTLDLMAWRKAGEAKLALEAVATVLAVVAAHTASRKNLLAGGELGEFQLDILERFPVGTQPVDFHGALGKLREYLTAAPALTEQEAHLI
ncbi:aromatic amino acid lyase [Arthrobacter sp. NPDC055138]